MAGLASELFVKWATADEGFRVSLVKSPAADQRIQQNNSPTPSLQGDGRWELVLRVAASPEFHKSTRLRDFLLYVSECALNNRSDEVNEQLIGLRVFDRPMDYNPAEDNIVRVSARQLRTKLKEYFETHGCEERWLLEIPKGGYLPVFHERTSQDRLGELKTSARDGSARLPRPWTVALAFVAVVSLILNVWFWSRIREAPNKAGPVPPENFVTAVFGGSPTPIQVVVSDSSLVLMQTLAGRRFALEEYVDRSYLRPPANLPKDSGELPFWDFLASRQLSNIGDMGVAERISVSMLGGKSQVTIRNARNLTARDFAAGNVILLGSAYSNPWSQLFEDRLNFRFAADGPGGPTELRNMEPLPGEKAVYPSSQRQGGGGVSCARVALVHNLTGTGRALLVAGTTMESTEAVANFLLNSSSPQELLHVLGTSSTAHIPDFELLFETSAVQGTAKSAHVIAHRVYPPAR